MAKKYLTVVFEYEDGAQLPQELTAAFASESCQYHDTRITAVSTEDEISRVEQLENESYGQITTHADGTRSGLGKSH